MNNLGNMAITGIILLISVVLIGVVAMSVLSSSSGGISEEDLVEFYDQVVDESVDQITAYLQITDKLGKYYGAPHQQKIEKIAIMVKPLVSIEIDMSELTIILCDRNAVKILNSNRNTAFMGSQSLFGHSLWDNITENTFGFIVVHDKDNSLINYNTINKNSDMAYIIIKLSEDFYMEKGDIIVASLLPGSGIKRTTILEAPLPMKSVVYL